MHVIEFSPPMSGFDNEFNTFRVGVKWSKRLKVGDVVGLIDTKESKLFGIAEVVGIHQGKLRQVAEQHACRNHNQLGLDPAGAADRLIANMFKRYGPRIINDDKQTTVIELRRLKSWQKRNLL